MQAESDAALADGEAGKPMNTMHILTDKKYSKNSPNITTPPPHLNKESRQDFVLFCDLIFPRVCCAII